MPLYDAVKDLPLTIERVELEPNVLPLKHITRRTTVFHLHGGGHEGVGEDVTYEEGAATRTSSCPTSAASTRSTPSPSSWPRSRATACGGSSRRRSTWRCARRAARSPTQSVARRRPSRSSSRRTTRASGSRLAPDLRFKLDASDSWTDEVVAELAATGAVDVVDLKGLYEGDWVDATPSAELYGRVAEAFPKAWLEDARINDETRPVLEPHRDRLTWDFPIHSVDDVEALEWPPRCLNSKPSRFGSVRRLFDFYDHCAANGIAVYGGGQFELGPGRGQIQHLASLFHADAPNDVAPKEYNEGGPRPGLPQSPLPAASRDPGFR